MEESTEEELRSIEKIISDVGWLLNDAQVRTDLVVYALISLLETSRMQLEEEPKNFWVNVMMHGLRITGNDANVFRMVEVPSDKSEVN